MASIGNSAFYDCTNLTEVSIPNSVTSIGSGALDGCVSLTGITIPKNVRSISGGAFMRCAGLTGIDVASGNSQYVSVDGILFNSDQTTLHTYPAGKSGTFCGIPASVTAIAGWAFSRCKNLTGVAIPEGVTSIGWRAFDGCTDLAHVYYAGTEAQWGNITIGTSNECLTNVAIHFESSGPESGAAR